MNLSELEIIAKEVSQSVAQITEKPFDIDALVLKPYNKSVFEDEHIKKALQIESKPKLKYNTFDKIFYGPKDFIMKQYGYIALSFLNSVSLMKHDSRNVILVSPKFLNKKINSIKAFMAHELIHVQDEQLYGSESLNFLEDIVLVKEKILEKRHELGILKGYILPSQDIKELKREYKQHQKKLNNYMAIVESHAEYVKARYMNDENISIKDIYTRKEIVQSVLMLPLLLLPGIGKKMKQYNRGKELVKNAYSWQVPMEKLYHNVPEDDDFKHVSFYLQKYTPDGRVPFCTWKDLF